MIDVVTAPSISGVRTTPDDVAEVPITPCTNSGTYEIVPNIAIPTSAMERTLDATTGLSSRPASTSAPTTCAELHEYWRPPQTSPSSSAVVPAASTPAPSQSIECSCL